MCVYFLLFLTLKPILWKPVYNLWDGRNNRRPSSLKYCIWTLIINTRAILGDSVVLWLEGAHALRQQGLLNHSTFLFPPGEESITIITIILERVDIQTLRQILKYACSWITILICLYNLETAGDCPVFISVWNFTAHNRFLSIWFVLFLPKDKLWWYIVPTGFIVALNVMTVYSL